MRSPRCRASAAAPSRMLATAPTSRPPCRRSTSVIPGAMSLDMQSPCVACLACMRMLYGSAVQPLSCAPCIQSPGCAVRVTAPQAMKWVLISVDGLLTCRNTLLAGSAARRAWSRRRSVRAGTATRCSRGMSAWSLIWQSARATPPQHTASACRMQVPAKGAMAARSCRSRP